MMFQKSFKDLCNSHNSRDLVKTAFYFLLAKKDSPILFLFVRTRKTIGAFLSTDVRAAATVTKPLFISSHQSSVPTDRSASPPEVHLLPGNPKDFPKG